jgi:hypothetical protein
MLLIFSRQLHIAVPTGHQENGVAGEFLGYGLDIAKEGLCLFIVSADTIVNDGAFIGRAGGILPKADRAQPIGLMKGTGYAIHVNIAAKKQGQNVLGHRITPLVKRERDLAILFPSASPFIPYPEIRVT